MRYLFNSSIVSMKSIDEGTHIKLDNGLEVVDNYQDNTLTVYSLWLIQLASSQQALIH